MMGLQSPDSNPAYRQTARARIEDAIKRMREEANQLEALLKQIPEELTPAADIALWSLACLLNH